MLQVLRVSLVAALVCAIFTARADAVFEAFWEQRTISAAAIADDPALANMQCWSLMVTYDVGRWASAGVRATLPPGHVFYQHSFGGNTAPNPGFFPFFPALEFDTYATSPTRTSTNVLGGYPASPLGSFGGADDPIPGTFSVSWAGPIGGDLLQGTFEVARLTFPMGVLPVILQGPPPGSQSTTYTIHPDAYALIGQIPEPVAPAAIILCALTGMVRRR